MFGICVRVKDEQGIIREWVRHYIQLVFQKVVIYDDGLSPPVKETLTDCYDDRVIIVDTLTANKYKTYSYEILRYGLMGEP